LDTLTKGLEDVARTQDPYQTQSKCKAIVALFPYAVQREQCGDSRMVEGFWNIAKIHRGRWTIERPLSMLLDEVDLNFPSLVMTLVSPYADWRLVSNTNAVTRWAAAALAAPYTEEVCESVVDTLLQIASNIRLQSSIPIDMWAWLKKRPSLQPICGGRKWGTEYHVVRRVRELGDVELLESYFLLVWSEWDYIQSDGLTEMCASIRECFGGVGMWRHREVLIKRLDHVLGELDKGLDHLNQQVSWIGEYHIQRAREDYGKLKVELLGVDRKALENLTRTPFKSFNPSDLLTQRMSTESHSTFICALPLLW